MGDSGERDFRTDAMTTELLFAMGLFIIGFTLLFLMPESMKRHWAELEYKPPAADTVVLMLRFLGLLLIAFGVAVLSGAVEVFPPGADS